MAKLTEFIWSILAHELLRWQELSEDNFSWPEVSDKASLPGAFFLGPRLTTLSTDGFMFQSSPETLLPQSSCNLLHVPMPMVSLLRLRLSGLR